MAKPAPSSLNSSIARSRRAAFGREVLVRVDQQVAVGPVLVAPDAAAELVQVGQAVAVGLVDEDRVGVGDVQPALDDRRRQQHVELAGRRSRASPLPARARPSGRGRCRSAPRARSAAAAWPRRSMSWTRLWTKKICPPRFSSRRTAWRISSASNRVDARLDRQPVLRRRLQVRDVAHAQERHVQRPRDRRGRHRQHVDRRAAAP